MKLKRSIAFLIALVLALSIVFTACDTDKTSDFDNGGAVENGQKENSNKADKKTEKKTEDKPESETTVDTAANPEDVSEYSGNPYVVLNGNKPEFKEDEITDKSYEFYSKLDSLGRCGYTMACVGKDLMPTEERGSISSVKPSGWINNKYDPELVDGGYIYNRCHLIGFQLTGENANKENLITGTRYMNVDGMLPFENMVADYVKETDNHVMYRVTPIYVGNNLLASGVQMEAYSVEDDGEGVCFNVYVYNVQPGIVINYANGDNWLSGETPPQTETESETSWDGKYVLNKGTKKIHKSNCSNAKSISEQNRQEHIGLLDDLVAQGYIGCGLCKPLE